MIVKRSVQYLDDRLGSSAFLRAALTKVFPDHWSFMLGEICVYAFLALLITGTYIAFFFNDSSSLITYNGPYTSLIGRMVPQAYASVLNLSFQVPLGLLIRQMHHWAALVFIGSIILHMMRIFFTGAFRKPREINWTIGILLFLLAMGEGFLGYSLPDDLLSGAGLRIAYSVAQSIPYIGSSIAFAVFGGVFPTENTTQRFYVLHVWILPLLMAGVIALHLGMVWRQHHTQFPGRKATENNVVGSKLWPSYAIKSIALMIMTFAVLALLGGFFTINPVWMYGPFEGWKIASPSQPDWYLAWLDGSLRLGPAISLTLFGHTISPLFWSGIVLPLVLFGCMFAWPEIERIVTHDELPHNLDDMPYEKPWRLGIGVAVFTFGAVLGTASSDDLQANYWHIDVESLLFFYRILLVVAPIALGLLAFVIGSELRTRFETRDGQTQVRRATLIRNAQGGYDEQNL